MAFKRLFWDIETSPNVCLVWKTGYKLDVTPESIIEERKIITIAWKWSGEHKVHSVHWDHLRNDKTLLQCFIPVLNSADESVAHFGDSFDLPWVKGRCLFHRIRTMPKYKTVDTCKWASLHFDLNSNKLNYLAKFLGIGQKLRTEYNLWKEIVLRNDRKSLGYMVKYNKEDVRLLEKVHDRLAEEVPHHTHLGVMQGKERWSCPKCASVDVKTTQTRVSAAGVTTFSMQCKKCGGFYSLSTSVHNKYVEDRE
jgi:RNase P subunit RPR2